MFAGRSEAKTRAAMEEIASATGSHALEFALVDLADLDSVRAGATRMIDQDAPIDVLVNNAGGGVRGVSAQGFELSFATNHLGHFLLTTLLLNGGHAPRIVNVASNQHKQARRIDFDALRQPTASRLGAREYAVAKLCNVLFAQELARRGHTAVAVHPGVVATGTWSRLPGPARAVVSRLMKTPEEGARTSVWCATAPAEHLESGGYYADSKPTRPSKVATAALAEELWCRSEEWTRPYVTVG